MKKYFTARELAVELKLRSAQQLNYWLHLAGFQYKCNGTWLPYAKIAGQGLVEIIEDGHAYNRLFTRKGREYVIELITEIRSD